MACSFSAVRDPSRLSGSLSSQARYSSCKSSRAVTAAAQRVGRGAGRVVGDAGGRGTCWRNLARCRACRSAALIGAAPMRVWTCRTPIVNRDSHVCEMTRGEPAIGRRISRLQSCIRGSGGDRTMMQPCASTARFRGGGAHSLRRRGSHACLGSPPPRIVISARRCWRRALSSLGQPGVDGALTTRDEARRRAALRRS